MPRKIERVTARSILNSHAEYTYEFIIELSNGNIGVGSSPKGETISVYEDRKTRSNAEEILNTIRSDSSLKAPITQSQFDHFLEARIGSFGRNNCWALSLAFFNATQYPPTRLWPKESKEAKKGFPRLCLNILNGGEHAYTNPVRSDFPEFLVVPKFDDVSRVIKDHATIQSEVHERLAPLERSFVNKNPVYHLGAGTNDDCMIFLQEVMDRVGLSSHYEMMIDASAGDLLVGKGYKFSVTDGSTRSSNDLLDYWLEKIDDYDIGFLEDPFGELDVESWRAICDRQSRCRIIGDNFYSSDAGRIEKGARDRCTNGVIIKPNQAGTVSSVVRAIEVSRSTGQIAITSHRSISTESTFLSVLTVMGNVGYMKIGPLFTDYSSVMRLNELIRLTGDTLG
ncbi:MAG TPA: hypothetical protein VMB46_00280 [Methanomassiliicoccales archaeon]|nr:hypothetical protein [Methanomassiliicoccales archaeon]